MEKKDCGESLRVHSMLRFSIMLIALPTPQIMILFGISRGIRKKCNIYWGQPVLISLSEVWTVVRLSSNVYSRNIHMLAWDCTCINKRPSYRFSPLAKQINCMKILPFIATMLMTSNIEQTTSSFLDYCPPPPPPSPHTRTRKRSQWRQRLRLLHTLALRERHVNVAMERPFCVNPDQTGLSGAGWGGSTLIDQTYHFKYLVK